MVIIHVYAKSMLDTHNRIFMYAVGDLYNDHMTVRHESNRPEPQIQKKMYHLTADPCSSTELTVSSSSLISYSHQLLSEKKL